MGHVVGEVQRVDERDILFARVEGLQPGTEQYHEYYEMHPENKAYDDRRRESGGFPVGPPGAIDKGYPPTVAMTEATFHMCFFVGDHAVAEPLVELLRSRARSEGMSINRMIKKLLEETLDVTPRYKDANRGDCEEFYGMWSESDLREFEKRTEEFRQGNLWLTPAGEDSIPNNI